MINKINEYCNIFVFVDHEYEGNKLKVEYASYYVESSGGGFPQRGGRGGGRGRGGGGGWRGDGGRNDGGGGRGRGGGRHGMPPQQHNITPSEGDWNCPDPG